MKINVIIKYLLGIISIVFIIILGIFCVVTVSNNFYKYNAKNAISSKIISEKTISSAATIISTITSRPISICSEQTGQDYNSKVMTLYNNFLSGKMIFYDEFNNEISIEDVFRFENQDLRNLNKYAFYDINGDGIIELLTKQVSNIIYIFTVKDGKLVIWLDGSPYSEVLNDGTILLTRDGGAPIHVSYSFYIFDFNGKEKYSIDFDKYDENEDGKYDDKDYYSFDDIEVTKNVWDGLTKRFFNIKSDKIKWENYNQENFISN